MVPMFDPYYFKSLLLQLSDSLSREELGELKFLCEDVLPRYELERINDGLKLFEALENRNMLSEGNRDFLASILIGVNRTDVGSKLLETEG